jgi:hypothetical protein
VHTGHRDTSVNTPPADAVGWIYHSAGWQAWIRPDDLRNPHAQEYAPDAEPSLRELLREQPERWPLPRLPERRCAELEAMLGLTTPSTAFRWRLYQILETVVRCDRRISPRQRDAAEWYDAHRKRLRERLKGVEKAARELHGLLTPDDARDQLELHLALDPACPYPRASVKEHPAADFAARVAAVADAAGCEAQRGRRRRGQPQDEICAWLVRHLADLYAQATGTRPGRSTSVQISARGGTPGGPFGRFVGYVYGWLGDPYAGKTAEAVAGDIRRYAGRGRIRRWWPPGDVAAIATDRTAARE